MKSYIIESERLFYKDNHNWIFKGDCRSMSELPDECVQGVVTSPPFWGLRKYSGEQDLIWDGDENCQHQWAADVIKHDNLRFRGEGSIVGNEKNRDIHTGNKVAVGFCSLCGAWKGAYGLEPTPEMYIEHTIQILREIRRVLRKDGVVFWDIGDSYNSGEVGRQDKFKYGGKSRIEDCRSGVKGHPYLKPKDLCLIPFRVAIAAQEDGWWVRSVIIWSKKNPMPESVTDRPSESHEYILMLTKSARYYFDQDAVRIPNLPQSITRSQYPVGAFGSYSGDMEIRQPSKRTGVTVMEELHPMGRNIRSVWEFPTQPYPEAHFAVFPEKLPEICIKAASPEVGCCSKCGAPWERISEKEPKGRTLGDPKLYKSNPVPGDDREYKGGAAGSVSTKTLGWQPTCKCNADKVPSLVLDPFSGSSTTLAVAKRLGRYAIGYELSLEYCKLGQRRVEAITAPFPNLTCP